MFCSLLNFVLETSSYFREPYDVANNYSLSRSEREELTKPHTILIEIEKFCNSFFTAEIFLRFVFAPDKLRFISSPNTILEILSILPFCFPTQSKNGPKTWAVKAHNYLEVLYILRILRIFALVPKYSGLKVLLLTIKTSLGELFLYALLLIMTLMIFATFVFYAEQINETERNQFDSILIGLWWAIVTITTLGYGDIVPVTPFGRLVGACCALCGLVFLALPIPIIVNNFTTYYTQAKAHQRLKSYVAEKKGLFNRAIALHLNTVPLTGNQVLKVSFQIW
jgi:potassium voltage-gated channel Shaw-related subfamily C protein 1